MTTVELFITLKKLEGINILKIDSHNRLSCIEQTCEELLSANFYGSFVLYGTTLFKNKKELMEWQNKENDDPDNLKQKFMVFDEHVEIYIKGKVYYAPIDFSNQNEEDIDDENFTNHKCIQIKNDTYIINCVIPQSGFLMHVFDANFAFTSHIQTIRTNLEELYNLKYWIKLFYFLSFQKDVVYLSFSKTTILNKPNVVARILEAYNIHNRKVVDMTNYLHISPLQHAKDVNSIVSLLNHANIQFDDQVINERLKQSAFSAEYQSN